MKQEEEFYRFKLSKEMIEEIDKENILKVHIPKLLSDLDYNDLRSILNILNHLKKSKEESLRKKENDIR